ncbi:MAG: response regulator [Candidatus Thermofonsia bacterium]|nr:MAG: response regulator [Candidatus Thermofonsia bacterium]
MAENIRVLIVDDLPETRENVRKLLQFESDVEVIGQAGTGEEAVQMAQEYQPDIILMDINMPGIDGIGASQKISELVPRSQIIIMSVQSDSDYLRRAMLAGARDFLTKPFGGDELITAIRRVHEKRPQVVARPSMSSAAYMESHDGEKPRETGKVITVFSPKGGCGCTTVSINLAVTLAKRNFQTLLIDGSLQFGDVAVMLNMKPTTSIVDLSDRNVEVDHELVSSVVQVHKSGLHVLLAPPRPEMADVITEDLVKELVEAVRPYYDFIIIDTSSSLNDIALSILDMSDKILLITQQNLPSLKNISRFFDLAENLEYEPDKTWMIVNRASAKPGISVKDVSDTLKRPVFAQIPDEGDIVEKAVNEGVPLVSGQYRKRPVSLAVNGLADQIVREMNIDKKEEKTEAPPKKQGLFSRLFNR